MSDHAEECNCIACRFGIVQVEAGVTGNEGKDEAQRSESVQRDTEGIHSSDASGDGHLDRKTPGLVASPAVVTAEQWRMQRHIGPGEWSDADVEVFAASKVAELAQKAAAEIHMLERQAEDRKYVEGDLREEIGKGFDAIFPFVPEALDETGKELSLADKITQLAAKVSELEAQLQQARFVIDNKQGIIDELERMRAGGKS